MHWKTHTVAIAAAALVATAALAQTRLTRDQEKEAIGILTQAGATCERVTRTQMIGKLPTKDTLMAVACKGGGKYVLKIDTRVRMSFYSTCDALAKANNNLVRCFTYQHAPPRRTTR